ncbi:hypothetical protein SAMN02910358_01826 [Lachnospiraceae bacterium XBB1006]|nr:hypothetical protein SAMN02910358_01826 [Lachnospiraceae bacterium XBB1006]
MECDLIFSGLALLISLGVAICDYRINIKINKLNMEAEIYTKVFFKYFIEIIPQAQQNIKNTANGLTGTDMLENGLNDLRKEALFFYYHDEAFYKKLCSKLQSLEDKIIKANNGIMDEVKYHLFSEEVRKDIAGIYTLVMNKYEGLK